MTFPSSVSGPFKDLQRGKISGDEYARRTLREAKDLIRESPPRPRQSDKPAEKK